MNIHRILEKPVWKNLAQRPGFAALSIPSIETTNGFFEFIVAHGLASPTAGDVRNWLGDCPQPERTLRIDHLQEVFAVCQPSFLGAIREARRFAPPKSPRNPDSKAARPASFDLQRNKSCVLRPVYETQDWDPIAPPTRRPPRKRAVSIAPWGLPLDYQSELRRAADGLPGQEPGMQVPARSMVLRMREKLCQYAWSVAQHNLDAELSLTGIDAYLADLKTRLLERPHGLRWATMRATADALLLFTRYEGAQPEIIQHLADYRRDYEVRESAQRALKFFALARTGNSTDRILDMAEALLAAVEAEVRPKKRHQMRNGAAILAIFGNAPLRNASAQLAFGESLFWKHDEWVIRTEIQKTQARRPELFDFPLHPEAGRFVDAIVLGDASPAMLPTLRERLIRDRRQLFLLPNGHPAAATYIPRVFQALTGNSFTTLRVMLYSDAIAHHGIEGIELAKPAAHHASTDIVKSHYIAEEVAEIRANCIRNRRSRRLSEMQSEKHRDLMVGLEKYSETKPR
ncbi:hypothetical protein E2L08_08420 [Palleronia sediminis]|uniref:Uncharacterized protein n=1 Tax=Palleronia sediminis TaxID=2547833 RepID=A0A4R6AEF6_9RHOB|nr:hypothetical protein [Palleronia sediminis]TDL79623.1 hypothetical protein E2L08_08420 [Palleronia sediminis]